MVGVCVNACMRLLFVYLSFLFCKHRSHHELFGFTLKFIGKLICFYVIVTKRLKAKSLLLLQVGSLKGSTVLRHDLFTNDVLYAEVAFDMRAVRPDLLPLVPLFWYGFLLHAVLVFYVDTIMSLNNYLYIALVFPSRSLLSCVLYTCI